MEFLWSDRDDCWWKAEKHHEGYRGSGSAVSSGNRLTMWQERVTADGQALRQFGKSDYGERVPDGRRHDRQTLCSRQKDDSDPKTAKKPVRMRYTYAAPVKGTSLAIGGLVINLLATEIFFILAHPVYKM